MLKKVSIVAVGVLSGLSLTLASFAADVKIGVVDLQSLMTTSAQGKKLSKEMEDMMADSQKKMEKDGNELKAMMENFEKNKAVMSKDKIKDETAKINAKQVQLQQMRGQMQQQYMAKNQELMAKFTESAKVATASVAKSNGLDVVFPNNIILYAKSPKDITKNVAGQMK